MPNNLTYAKSGVNIRSADKFVKFISKITSKHRKRHKQNNIGNFGSITKIPKNLKNVHIVASTDGVGTKIEIANELNIFNTIGNPNRGYFVLLESCKRIWPNKYIKSCASM